MDKNLNHAFRVLKYFSKIKQAFLLFIRGNKNSKCNKPTEEGSRESGEKEEKRI